MLNLAILTRDQALCGELEELACQSGVFKVSVRIAPLPSSAEILRILRNQIPDVILLDLSDWETVSSLATKIHEAELRGAVVGVGHRWTRSEQLEFEAAGILEVIPAPVSAAQLEAKVYDALHQAKPIEHSNVLSFLPSKAGSGRRSATHNTTGLIQSKWGIGDHWRGS